MNKQSKNIEKMRERIAQNPFLLAPMAGYTDAVYRGICKQFGCGLTYTEMISAQGLAHNNKNTLSYLETSEFEDDVCVQLFGSDSTVISEQAARVEELMNNKLFAIDINMGCPVPKVVKKGEGSAMMLDIQNAAKVISATVSAVNVPVTVKFRRGFEIGKDISLEFGLAMQDAGASAVSIHGRFAKEFYHGKADWGSIAKVKQVLDIPVIASGDLLGCTSIASCLELTKVDGVMIARGAIGNPWIFRRCVKYMEGLREGFGDDGDSEAHWGNGFDWSNEANGDNESNEVDESCAGNEPPEPSVYERIEVARMHVERMAQNDPRSVVKMRSFIGKYFRGIPGAVKARKNAMKCNTPEDFYRYFDELKEMSNKSTIAENALDKNAPDKEKDRK